MCNQGWDIFISKSRRHRAPVTASISYFIELDSVLDFISPPLPPRHARSRVLTCTRVHGARAHDNSIESRFVTNSKTEYSKYVLDSLLLLLPSIHSISILPTRARRAIGDAMYMYIYARPARPSLLLGNGNMQIVSDILPFRRSEGLSAGPEH